MSLSDRIQFLVDAGFKKSDLAKASGKTPAAVSAWINGSTKEIKSDSAAGLQALTGFSAIWIATGKGPKKIEDVSNVSPGPKIGGQVLVLSSVQAGNFKEYVDNDHGFDGTLPTITTTAPVHRYTFAVRVVGDSMEPDFAEGSLLIIEPELDPLPNDFVVVKNGSDETTVKKLVRDGSDWYLKPSNDRYPIKKMTSDMRIVGVVRAMEKRFR